MAGTPVTRKEALQYDSDALRIDTEKRKNNIRIFEDAIEKEKKAIEQNEYILSQIDPEHTDTKQLRKNIEKIKVNIKTFEDAIRKEHEEIERDLKMIKLIKSN